MNKYEVTVTPKFAMYSGSWTAGSYTTEVYAKDRNEAIKRARREYEDGKTNPAKFTAKLKKDDATDRGYTNLDDYRPRFG